MATGGAHGSNFGPSDVFGPPARASNFEEEMAAAVKQGRSGVVAHYPAPNPGMFFPTKGTGKNESNGANKDLHIFIWSSNNYLVSDVFGGGGGVVGGAGNHDYGATDQSIKEVKMVVSPDKVEGQRDGQEGVYLVSILFNCKFLGRKAGIPFPMVL